MKKKKNREKMNVKVSEKAFGERKLGSQTVLPRQHPCSVLFKWIWNFFFGERIWI